MKTAAAHNAPQVGHYEARERCCALEAMFEACGVKLKFVPLTKSERQSVDKFFWSHFKKVKQPLKSARKIKGWERKRKGSHVEKIHRSI